MILLTAGVIAGVTVIIIRACCRATSSIIQINAANIKEEDKLH